ncbi:MAG: ABC transporter ATP-binding protein [Lachnospiraceae bacterium]
MSDNNNSKTKEIEKNEEYAIRVKDVSKVYRLYSRNRDRVLDAFGLSGKKKLYREHYALNHLSFDVHKGEAVGIIGVNGAGKSTILKIITGVLNPTEGNVEINGRISALLELGAGFNMEYTGMQNIYLNGMMIGFSREEIDAKMDEILAFADIGDFVNQPVKTYSSGMFVRLAFAIAINIDPEILIVDEALAVGDVFFQNKCFHKFDEFKKRGKTILIVSHDLSSIRKYCDRAILLDKGQKVDESTPAKIIDLYKRVLVGQFGEGVEDSQKISDPSIDPAGKWMSNYVINPKFDEYGDKEVEIVDFAVLDNTGKYTTTLEKKEPFSLNVKIKAHRKVTEPIVAFTIRSLRGTDVCGTNTMYEDIDLGTMQEGEEKTIVFKQNMDLQGAQYLLSFGCTRFEGDDFKVFHRLYDIVSLTVISEKNTVGFYDMNSEITVE